MTSVQATIRRYENDSGSAVLDDGSELEFVGVELVGLRRLHPGQRVRLVLVDGTVVRIAMP